MDSGIAGMQLRTAKEAREMPKEATERVPQMQRVIVELHERVNHLEKVTAALGEKLHPVLRIEPMGNAVEKDHEEMQMVPMAEEIAGDVKRITRMVELINRITERVEV